VVGAPQKPIQQHTDTTAGGITGVLLGLPDGTYLHQPASFHSGSAWRKSSSKDRTVVKSVPLHVTEEVNVQTD